MTLPRRILAMRFSALGDVAMTVPVLHSLAEQNPGVQVHMFSRPFFEPLFRHIPRLEFNGADIDRTYKGVGGLTRLFGKMRKHNPQAVADLHDVLRTKYLRVLFRATGTPVRIIDKGRAEKKELIRRGALQSRPLRSTHERYADVFRALGLQIDLSRYRPVKPPLSGQTQTFLNLFRSQKIIGFAPLAKHPGKQYPPGGSRELIRQLLDAQSDLVFLLFGAPSEKKLLDTLISDPNRVFNLAGMFDFPAELEIISRLRLMIAMDSGNGHLAAIYGVPVFTIWGITHPYAGFAPLGQDTSMQIHPPLEKFPRIPCSVYGNKICPGYEKIWDELPPEAIADKLFPVIQHL